MLKIDFIKYIRRCTPCHFPIKMKLQLFLLVNSVVLLETCLAIVVVNPRASCLPGYVKATCAGQPQCLKSGTPILESGTTGVKRLLDGVTVTSREVVQSCPGTYICPTEYRK